MDFLSQAQDLFDYTRRLRRDFHRHPELGFQEVRTASIVAEEINSLGLELRTGVAETGVIALLEGDTPGPTVLVRFDMDALPIQEETLTEYASQNPGVMHACGHDGHTAIGLTVAHLLHRERHHLRGKVKLVFQPAEEGLGGARRMVEQGVLSDPIPDYALALHLWNEKPLGWIGVNPGACMAAAEIFKLRLTGKGGHGAVPNLAIDPIVAAAQVVNALQTIVARTVSPLQSAVVSITSIHGGDAFNVIPSQVELLGTIRTFDPQVRNQLIQRFEQIVNGTAQAMNCQADLELTSITPAVINNPQVTEHVLAAAKRLFPQDYIETQFSTMGSEDMALMMRDIPGCYFFLGSANPAKGFDAPHHHSRFDFDEQVLPKAAALMAAAVCELLD